MLETLRAQPGLARTQLGMRLQSEAIKKIKGAEWENILFPKPISLDAQREIKSFRGKCDTQEKAFQDAQSFQFEERAKKSQRYIEQAKERKARMLSGPDDREPA